MQKELKIPETKEETIQTILTKLKLLSTERKVVLSHHHTFQLVDEIIAMVESLQTTKG